MNRILASAAATAIFLAPVYAEAKNVTISATLKNYGSTFSSRSVYLAVYLVDPAGQYAGTLWVAGSRARYYRHLTDWVRASGGRVANLDGITGASVGSGRTLSVSANIADALLNAGYTVHVDTALEEDAQYGSEVVVPLSSAANGKAVGGQGYIQSFKVTF